MIEKFVTEFLALLLRGVIALESLAITMKDARVASVNAAPAPAAPTGKKQKENDPPPAPAPAPPTPPPAAAPLVDDLGFPIDEVPAAPPKVYTAEEVFKLAKDTAIAKGRPAVKTVYVEFHIDNVKDLKPEQYSAFVASLAKL